ncbi:hypothetical protein ACHAXN_009750 [Cyclotella atomus]
MSNDAPAHINQGTSSMHHTPELESLLSKLRPFQRAAFDFAVHGVAITGGNGDKRRYKQPSHLMENNGSIAGSGTGRLLLGDEMGLGKTLSSLAIMLAYQKTEWPLLILCPASLRYTWPAEIEKFCPWIPSTAIHVVRGKDDVQFAKKIRGWRETIACGGDNRVPLGDINRLDDGNTQQQQQQQQQQKEPPIQIVIVTYSLLQERFQVANILNRCNFQCIIADESHNLKQMSSQRCQLALPLLQNSRRLVLLSGTPALNRPVELWPQLVALDPSGKILNKYGMKYTEFTRRYCNAKPTRFGWDVKGVSNAEELHTKLKKVMVRRLKSEVLHDLPAKQRSMVPVDVVNATDKEKCSDLIRQLNTVRHSLAEILDEACDEDANAARFESRSLLMQAYQASGIAKAPATTDYILDWLEGSGTQKLVVFAHHKDVLDYMEAAISAKYKGKLGMMRIDGSVPPAERALRVKKFQSNAGMRLALLSMTAAGVGLTLTAASSIVFAELHWVPGVLAQAEDRCHRIGQVNSVNVMYCICKDVDVSVDMNLWNMLGRKVGTLGRVVDGQRGKGMNALEVDGVVKQGVSAEEDLANFFASNSNSAVQKGMGNVQPVKGTIQSFFTKQAAKLSSKSITTKTPAPAAAAVVRANQKQNATVSLLDDSDDECSLNSGGQTADSKQSASKSEELLFIPFTCHACTYENPGGYSCEMCSTPRAAADRISQITQSQMDVVELDEDDWACNVCTLLNKSSHLSCTACGEERSRRKDATIDLTELCDAPSRVSQSPSSSTQSVCSEKDQAQFKSSAAEKLPVSEEDLLSFSVSKNSGRVALHHGGQPLHVNFDISQILTQECSNQLEECALSRSIPGIKAALPPRKFDFDHRAVAEVIDSTKLTEKVSNDVMIRELKSFVLRYMELREIEKKAIKESGLAVTSSSLKTTAAKLVVSSVSGETERYVGGAKEKANLNKRNNCASKRDIDIINGKACAWCGETLLLQSNTVVDATYCSYKCAEEGRVRRGGMYSSARIRSQIFSLEHGVCCLCKLDAHALYNRILSLHPAERLNALMKANFKLPKSPTALNKLLQDPKEQDFWQADHIVAVSEGGGGCGIDNLRTLCTTCHSIETEKLHSRLKTSQVKVDSNQMDLLTAFTAGLSQGSDSTKKRKRRTAD